MEATGWNNTSAQPHILVVGGGSAGQRHVRNLLSLGAQVDLVEPYRALLQVPGRKVYTNLYEALQGEPYLGAVVAVPTHLHAECARGLLERGVKTLIEKPLAHTVAAAETWLKPYAANIRVGYSMRYHPAIVAIREHLPEIGRVLYAHAEVGQHLPQWHPGEDYRLWYMSRKEQGGGAILDLSHELDYLQWLLAPISKADAFVGHIDPTLEITSDDLADIRGMLGESTRFSCHMDLIDRAYNRRVRILGEDGSIDWDHYSAMVRVGPDEYTYNTDRNAQFLAEAKAFLAWCTGWDGGSLCTYAEAFHTLDVVESLASGGLWLVPAEMR